MWIKSALNKIITYDLKAPHTENAIVNQVVFGSMKYTGAYAFISEAYHITDTTSDSPGIYLCGPDAVTRGLREVLHSIHQDCYRYFPNHPIYGACIAIPAGCLSYKIKKALEKTLSTQPSYAELLKVCPALLPNFEYYKPVEQAIINNDPTIIEELCIGFSQKKDELLMDALSKACQLGNLNFTRYLIEEKGAPANLHILPHPLVMSTRDTGSMVHLAAGSGNLELVRYLVEDKQIKIDYQGDRTPFEKAAYNGHTEVIKYLINHCDAINVGFIERVLQRKNDELTQLLLAKIATLPRERIDTLLAFAAWQFSYPSRDYIGFHFNEIVRTLSHYFTTHQQQVSVELMEQFAPYASKEMILHLNQHATNLSQAEWGRVLKRVISSYNTSIPKLQWLVETISFDWVLAGTTTAQANRPGYEFLCAAAQNFNPAMFAYIHTLYPLDLKQIIHEDNQEVNAYAQGSSALLVAAVRGKQLLLIKHWFEFFKLKPSYECLCRLNNIDGKSFGIDDIGIYLYQCLRASSPTTAHGFLAQNAAAADSSAEKQTQSAVNHF